ncbi:hypothetical protein J2W37_004218 [Variovorax paradoxus]|uniref:Uncharacterized protein n=1 Tax=Variovorax paradoxus TaxID=34073 RepID=A0AAE4BVZ8_VARPD|nr:hypothetical protein [Variovorax paradoxus]MDR6423965.1 hypothetical protein [Variovorax paradoxus]MDR6452761.1 hypothetical protein [Variovorax paradoxus]
MVSLPYLKHTYEFSEEELVILQIDRLAACLAEDLCGYKAPVERW